MRNLFNLGLLFIIVSVNSIFAQDQSAEAFTKKEKIQKIMDNFNNYNHLYGNSPKKLSIEKVFAEFKKIKNAEHDPLVNALKKIVDKHPGCHVEVKNPQLDSIVNELKSFVDEHPKTDIKMYANASSQGVLLEIRFSYEEGSKQKVIKVDIVI